MPIVCSRCNRNGAGEPGMFKFEIDGFRLESYKSGEECPECRKELLEGVLHKYPNLASKKEDGGTAVNWPMIEDERGRRDYRSVEEMLHLVLALGLLSFSPYGNWIVKQIELNCNPQLFSRHLYFVREEDAKAYAEYRFSASSIYTKVCPAE